jgi:oligopeptide transport system ATP-binding protein
VNNGSLVEVKDLFKYFPIHAGLMSRHVADVRAVDGVSFRIEEGETLGLVGESGSGKTTIGRLLLRLLPATKGEIIFENRDVLAMNRNEIRRLRRSIQIIFQDPFASLNPRMSIGEIIAEPVRIHGIASGKGVEERVQELLSLVGLQPYHANRYPHEFSGGQRQRVGVARALAVDPRFIVCDEPVSALDVSIQAQIVNLLNDLQDELGLTYVFVAHDIGVVRHISDRIAVMNQGKIVETGDADQVCEHPRDDYTKKLLAAVPIPDPRESAVRRHERQLSSQ